MTADLTCAVSRADHDSGGVLGEVGAFPLRAGAGLRCSCYRGCCGHALPCRAAARGVRCTRSTHIRHASDSKQPGLASVTRNPSSHLKTPWRVRVLLSGLLAGSACTLVAMPSPGGRTPSTKRNQQAYCHSAYAISMLMVVQPNPCTQDIIPELRMGTSVSTAGVQECGATQPGHICFHGRHAGMWRNTAGAHRQGCPGI